VTASPEPALRPALSGAGERLVVEFEGPDRCVSSAVLGGGLGWVRTWLDLEVVRPYTRTDPDVHLLEESSDLPAPVVGMLTAARVARFQRAVVGGAWSVTTVGVGHALCAAGSRPRAVPAVGTINLLVVVDEPLTDAGLVNALQTAVEAKAQALAVARVMAANAVGYATGTATDSVCVACPPGARSPFAGPVTRVGAELALAVLEAVRSGAELDRSPVASPAPARPPPPPHSTGPATAVASPVGARPPPPPRPPPRRLWTADPRPRARAASESPGR
jgi:adenosylcobinamide amidohydrolase